MFQTAGAPCSVTVEGACIHFRGIIGRADVEEVDDSGNRYIRNDSALRIQKDLARKLFSTTLYPVTVNGKEFFVQDVKYEDDGETAICLLIPKNENEAI